MQSVKAVGNGYSYSCCQWEMRSVPLYVYVLLCYLPPPSIAWKILAGFLCESQSKLSQLKGDGLNLVSAALDTMKCRSAALGTCSITGKQLLHFWWAPRPWLVEGPSQCVETRCIFNFMDFIHRLNSTCYSPLYEQKENSESKRQGLYLKSTHISPPATISSASNSPN